MLLVVLFACFLFLHVDCVYLLLCLFLLLRRGAVSDSGAPRTRQGAAKQTSTALRSDCVCCVSIRRSVRLPYHNLRFRQHHLGRERWRERERGRERERESQSHSRETCDKLGPGQVGGYRGHQDSEQVSMEVRSYDSCLLGAAPMKNMCRPGLQCSAVRRV